MKLLYRIDEVAEMLSISKRTVYRLLGEGLLRGHSNDPGKSEIRITIFSIEEYVAKFELPTDHFCDKSHPITPLKRKIISKGID